MSGHHPRPGPGGPGGNGTSTGEGLCQYAVTLSTPRGEALIEVATQHGPDAAARRAWLAGVQQRWGDVDEVVVIAVRQSGTDQPAPDDQTSADQTSVEATGPHATGQGRAHTPAPAPEARR